jgi:uncharacterized membrane protein
MTPRRMWRSSFRHVIAGFGADRWTDEMTTAIGRVAVVGC